jgi:hypothetical protein
LDGFGVWGGDALSNRDLWIFTIRKIAGSIGSQTFSRKWGYDKNLMIEALEILGYPWMMLNFPVVKMMAISGSHFYRVNGPHFS